jgi:peroxiredoxin
VESKAAAFIEAGFDVVAFSADDESDAAAFVQKAGLSRVSFGYGITLEQMQQLGLYVSDRFVTDPAYPFEQGKSTPFSEPATFVLNSSNEIALVEVTNSPAMRVELDKLLLAANYAKSNGYPIRGLSEPVGKPKPEPGTVFPLASLASVTGGEVSLLPSGGDKWKVIFVYRGIFCPVCAMFLPEVDTLVSAFKARNLELVAISADGAADAEAFAGRVNLQHLPVGYDLSVEQMHQLGLYVSDRIHAENGNTKPFSEPAVFVVNSDNIIQMVEISNSPAFRPTVDMLLEVVDFIKTTGYPIRGRHGL